MNHLTEIELENYKSFTSENIRFDNITCVVGANESGKSNLLDAIWHLAPENQKTSFNIDELRMGTPGYPDDEIRIVYKINVTKYLLGNFSSDFAAAIGRQLFLTKRGAPRAKPTWEGRIDVSQASTPDFVRINKKRKFIEAFQGSATQQKKWAKRQSDRGWFIRSSSLDLRQQPFKELRENGAIEILSGQDKVAFFGEVLAGAVLENIRIFRWIYQEGDFLPERVNIESFLAAPSSCNTVASMFRIAGWQANQFGQKLRGQNDTVYGIHFGKVQRKMDSLIRANWSTHDKLTLVLEHKGTYFTIHLKEPGSKTPPEYRSDGLKWYLTFLINFRARTDDIKHYILLIDEPGLYLHPRGQKDTLVELRTLSSKHDNQVIYTTHQTFLINKNQPESVRVLRRELDRSGSRAANPFYASKVSDIANLKENVLTDKLLREALGFQVSDISPINERNLLVEGVFDREVLHIANKHWQVLDLNEVSVIACSGAPNIAKHASLYNESGLKVVCLYDSDAPGIASFEKNTSVDAKHKRQIKDYVKRGSHCQTLEDLVPDPIFTAAYEKWLKQWGKSSSVPDHPRMKALDKMMSKASKADRMEMKHSLEDILAQEITAGFKEYGEEFKMVRAILEDLNQRLS